MVQSCAVAKDTGEPLAHLGRYATPIHCMAVESPSAVVVAYFSIGEVVRLQLIIDRDRFGLSFPSCRNYAVFRLCP